MAGGDAEPALLDEDRNPARATLLGPAMRGDPPNGLRFFFSRPRAEAAFLRLPVVVRYGSLQRRPFLLTDIPLPLAALSK
jgi:hypothetical protein